MGCGNPYGDLAIQLETLSSFSGQEITGIIHVSVKSFLDSSTLLLRFKGKEKTAWTETRTETTRNADGTSNSRTVTDYYSGKFKIFDFSRVIYSWPAGIRKGQFSLPFSFILPNNIPGSFHFSEGSTKADIIYNFQAVVLSSTNQKIKGKTPICIKQITQNFNSNLTLTKSARMKTWCFFNKGSCDLSVSYPQDTYSPSQIATFYVEVDNSNSKLNISSISSRLFYNLRIRDSNHRTHFIKKDVINDSVNINISSGQRLLQSSGVEINLNLPSKSSLLSQMYSTTGRLIECMYTNEIRADVDGSCMCCGDRPSIQTYMNIIPNIIAAPSAPTAPDDWNPMVLERVNLVCDSRPLIEPSAPEWD